jgi:hypothetical protein
MLPGQAYSDFSKVMMIASNWVLGPAETQIVNLNNNERRDAAGVSINNLLLECCRYELESVIF